MSDRLGELVPDGYHVVESDRLVTRGPAFYYVLRRAAERRARRLNATADTPLYRLEVRRIDEDLLVDLARAGTPNREPRRTARWAVVARQNHLRKNDPTGVH